MLNNRGQMTWKPVILIGAILVFFMIAWFLVNSTYWQDWSKTLSIDTAVQGFEGVLGSTFSWMNYVFGGIPSWLVNQVGQTSAVIITLFTWLLVFVTFGDIIAGFSTFSQPVSWIVALAISVIMANLKAIVIVLGFFIGVFAFLGGLAVLAGLVAAFIAFFAVNWGIGSFGPWVLRRRTMMIAEKTAIKSEAGGKKLGGIIRGMKEVGKAL